MFSSSFMISKVGLALLLNVPYHCQSWVALCLLLFQVSGFPTQRYLRLGCIVYFYRLRSGCGFCYLTHAPLLEARAKEYRSIPIRLPLYSGFTRIALLFLSPHSHLHLPYRLKQFRLAADSDLFIWPSTVTQGSPFRSWQSLRKMIHSSSRGHAWTVVLSLVAFAISVTRLKDFPMGMQVEGCGPLANSHPSAAIATTGGMDANTAGTFGSQNPFQFTATTIPLKTQLPGEAALGGMIETLKVDGAPGLSSIPAHPSLPFQPQIGDFSRMIGFHAVQGVEIDKLDPWDFFTMAKRARLTDTTAYKKVKWSKGSGGKWHYCDSSDIYIKVWETSYYSVWMDPDGWAHNVVWFLSDLKWENDGTVWEAWDWDYVLG